MRENNETRRQGTYPSIQLEECESCPGGVVHKPCVLGTEGIVFVEGMHGLQPVHRSLDVPEQRGLGDRVLNMCQKRRYKSERIERRAKRCEISVRERSVDTSRIEERRVKRRYVLEFLFECVCSSVDTIKLEAYHSLHLADTLSEQASQLHVHEEKWQQYEPESWEDNRDQMKIIRYKRR